MPIKINDSNRRFFSVHLRYLADNVSLESLYWRLQKLPLSHISYANVHRRLIGRASVNNLHGIQSRSSTGKDYTSSLYHLDNRNTIRLTQQPKCLEPKPFVITVPNSQGATPSRIAESKLPDVRCIVRSATELFLAEDCITVAGPVTPAT